MDGRTITSKVCMRCGHRWKPRKQRSRVCPRCHNAWWDTPRRGGASEK